jgi:hypothetical protein
MKTKIILIAIMAATLGGGTGLFVTRLLSAPTNSTAAERKVLYYTCPMHPSVKAEKPGNCQICGMRLQPVYEKPAGTNAPPATVKTNTTSAMAPCCCAPSVAFADDAKLVQ